MFPISVEPRAKAKRTGLQPPWENSFEIVRVWRCSMAAELARLIRMAVMNALVYILGGIEDIDTRREVAVKVDWLKRRGQEAGSGKI